MPKWGQHLIKLPEAYIIEHSTVDPKTMEMKIITRNLSHVKLMLVEETQTIAPTTFRSDWTEIKSDARFISNTAFTPIRSRIEGFGLKRFKTSTVNVKKSQGILKCFVLMV